MNKKGMDAVIATVLLIAITIALITAVYMFVVPWLQGQMGGAKGCYDAKIDFKSACYDSTLGVVKVSLSRSSDFGIDYVKVTVVQGDKSYENITAITSLPDKFGEKTYSSAYNKTKITSPEKVILVTKLSDGTECLDSQMQRTLTACA